MGRLSAMPYTASQESHIINTTSLTDNKTRRNNAYLAMTLPKSPSGNGGLPADQQST